MLRLERGRSVATHVGLFGLVVSHGLALSIGAAPLVVPVDQRGFEVTQNLSVPIHPSMRGIPVSTPVLTDQGFGDASRRGDIYLTVVSPDQRAVLHTLPVGGVLESVVYDNYVEIDGHHNPSVGMDQDGRVHLAVEHHNDSWNYFRSHTPRDPSGGFRQSAVSTHELGLQGRINTYPVMQQMSDGQLALAHRMSPHARYFTAYTGTTALALQRYEPGGDSEGQWIMSGAHVDRIPGAPEDSYEPSTYKTLAWTPGTSRTDGAGHGWYQSWRTSLAADASGGLHLAMPIYDGTAYPHATHVGYLYSPDGGETFFRADGSAYDFDAGPITHNTIDLVVEDQPRTAREVMRATVHVTALPDGTPIVGTMMSDPLGNLALGRARLHVFDPLVGEWIERETPAGLNNHNFQALGDGSIITIDDAMLFRTPDLGLTWEMYELPELAGLNQPLMMWDRTYSNWNVGARLVVNPNVAAGEPTVSEVWTIAFPGRVIPEPMSVALAGSICLVAFRPRRCVSVSEISLISTFWSSQ